MRKKRIQIEKGEITSLTVAIEYGLKKAIDIFVRERNLTVKYLANVLLEEFANKTPEEQKKILKIK